MSISICLSSSFDRINATICSKHINVCLKPFAVHLDPASQFQLAFSVYNSELLLWGQILFHSMFLLGKGSVQGWLKKCHVFQLTLSCTNNLIFFFLLSVAKRPITSSRNLCLLGNCEKNRNTCWQLANLFLRSNLS